MLKIVELEKQLMQTNKELDHLRVSVVMEISEQVGHHGDRRMLKQTIPVPWYWDPKASASTFKVFFFKQKHVTCAGGVCERQHSGAHFEEDGSGEGPDNSSSKSTGASGSGGSAGRRTWGTTTPKRGRGWRCG